MPTCHACIMLVTKNYLDDYLTPNEKAQVDHMFQGHNVVARISFDRHNMRKSQSELLTALKPYGA